MMICLWRSSVRVRPRRVPAPVHSGPIAASGPPATGITFRRRTAGPGSRAAPGAWPRNPGCWAASAAAAVASSRARPIGAATRAMPPPLRWIACSKALRLRRMCQPCVTSTMRVTPAGRSSATLRSAFSRVSRARASIHCSGWPNSRGAICAATSASPGPCLCAMAGAAAEGHRQGGFARQPQPVAQSCHGARAEVGAAVLRRMTLAPAAEHDDRGVRCRAAPAGPAADPAGVSACAGASSRCCSPRPWRKCWSARCRQPRPATATRPRRSVAAPGARRAASAAAAAPAAAAARSAPVSSLRARIAATGRSARRQVSGDRRQAHCYDCAGACGGADRMPAGQWRAVGSSAEGVMC